MSLDSKDGGDELLRDYNPNTRLTDLDIKDKDAETDGIEHRENSRLSRLSRFNRFIFSPIWSLFVERWSELEEEHGT